VILPIVKYGHPTLRQRGAKVERVTPEIAALVGDMLETMHAASGIGLAAQQVDRALQIMVIDVREVKDRPSTLERDGRPASVNAFMPLALINPEIKPAGPPVPGAEGCLSFPEIFCEITRPEQIEVAALDAQGEPLRFRCGGLLARAIQHEHDHLQGILFVDRMPIEEKDKLKPELDQLVAETRAGLRKQAA
jgi:peptide deformylase